MFDEVVKSAQLGDTFVHASLPAEYRPEPLALKQLTATLAQSIKDVLRTFQEMPQLDSDLEMLKKMFVLLDRALPQTDSVLEISGLPRIAAMIKMLSLVSSSSEFSSALLEGMPEELRQEMPPDLSKTAPKILSMLQNIQPILSEIAGHVLSRRPCLLEVEITVKGMRVDVDQLEKRLTHGVVSEIERIQIAAAEDNEWEIVRGGDKGVMRFLPPNESGFSVADPPYVVKIGAPGE